MTSNSFVRVIRASILAGMVLGVSVVAMTAVTSLTYAPPAQALGMGGGDI